MPWKLYEKAETKYNKKMRVILAELYAKHNSHEKVADELDISLRSLTEWRKRAGVRTILKVVPVDRPR